METDNFKSFGATLARTQRLAGVGTLTASVAHELNNPISIITTACHELSEQALDGRLTEEALMGHLQMIERNAWRAAQLVQTLRTYTHLDSPQPVKTDLNRIIEGAITLVDYQFRREYNVSIETSLNPDLEPVVWEQNQITQVLVNLLTNARDALQPDGGQITVSSWALPDEGAVAFAVRDSGPGIPDALLERIFDPFFTTKPAGEGTGLGLSIAAQIVAEHNGLLTAANHPDGGAKFTVVMPCERGAEKAAAREDINGRGQQERLAAGQLNAAREEFSSS